MYFWVSFLFPFFFLLLVLHLRTKVGVLCEWVGRVNCFPPWVFSHESFDGSLDAKLNSRVLTMFHLSSSRRPSCPNRNINYRFPMDEYRLSGEGKVQRVLPSPCDLLSMKVNPLVDLKQEICCAVLGRELCPISIFNIYVYRGFGIT